MFKTSSSTPRGPRWPAWLTAASVAVGLAACGGGSPGAQGGATASDSMSQSQSQDRSQAQAQETSLAASPTPLAGASAPAYTPLTWPNPRAEDAIQAGRRHARHARGRARARPPCARAGRRPRARPLRPVRRAHFERRTQDVTIYENVSPTNAAETHHHGGRAAAVWLYGTNFRAGYIGRRDGDPNGPSAVALNGDNGGMKRLPAFSLPSGHDLKTPVANYDALPSDPPSNYDTDLAVPPCRWRVRAGQAAHAQRLALAQLHGGRHARIRAGHLPRRQPGRRARPLQLLLRGDGLPGRPDGRAALVSRPLLRRRRHPLELVRHPRQGARGRRHDDAAGRHLLPARHEPDAGRHQHRRHQRAALRRGAAGCSTRPSSTARTPNRATRSSRSRSARRGRNSRRRPASSATSTTARARRRRARRSPTWWCSPPTTTPTASR